MRIEGGERGRKAAARIVFPLSYGAVDEAWEAMNVVP